MNPKFTVAIPLYNKKQFISRCLSSVKNQTYTNFDILIIDDGSTDMSNEAVKDWLNKNKDVQYSVTMKRQENIGALKTRNLLIQNSENRFVAFLDADDIWLPNHLDELKKLIIKYIDQVTLFSTGYYKHKGNERASHNLGKYSEYFGILDYFTAMSQSSGYINSSVVCIDKSKLFCDIFCVDLDVKVNEDLLVWSKLACDKGLAFSAVKTGINYIDAAEASKSGQLQDTFLVYNEILLMSKSWANHTNVRRYARIFAAKNIASFRLNNSLKAFLKAIIATSSLKSWCPTIMAILMLMVPKFCIKAKMII